MTRVDELQTERGGLVAALEALEAQHAAIDSELDTLYAQAERTPTAATQATVAELEATKAAFATQIRRKRAALTAVDADLKQAQQAEADAVKAAKVKELEAQLGAIADLAEQIDTAPFVAATWGNLARQCALANARFLIAGGRAGLVDDPLRLRAKVWAWWALHCDNAMGKGEQPTPIPTMATLLGLARAKGLLGEL